MKRKILPLVILSLIIIKAYPRNLVSAVIRDELGINKQFVGVDKNPEDAIRVLQSLGGMIVIEIDKIVLQIKKSINFPLAYLRLILLKKKLTQLLPD